MRNFKYRVSHIFNKLKKLINPSINTKDAFICWLEFVVGGWLNEGNIYCMEFAIKNLPSDAPIVEVGSFAGLSTNVISYFLRKHNKKNNFFTTDPWIFEVMEEDGFLTNSDIHHSKYRKFVMETYKRNVSFFSKNKLPYTYDLKANDFFEKWRKEENAKDIFGSENKLGGNISFCYIDGNHLYEYVKDDFKNCDKFLMKNGFVLFDDSAKGFNPGVTKLMKEVLSNKDYKLVINNPNYLLQKIS